MGNAIAIQRPGTVAAHSGGMGDFAPRDLGLIRRTVAADCNDDEFDLFISYARALKLDPRRRQIYAFVYSKNDPKKRRMSIIVGIDGFRTIAERTGNYRPDDEDTRFEVDPSLKCQSNPAGIVKATVSAFKFSHGAWHKVTASAHWEEYAPLKEEWSEFTEVANGTWPDGNPKFRKVPAPGATKTATLDTSGQWGKMPRLMLAKVAEALALRKAWPDDFSAVYSEEEVERATAMELSPSEAVEAGDVEDRLTRIGGSSGITFDWMDGGQLDHTPLGKIADRALEFIRAHAGEPSQLMMWRVRNRTGLQEFWARAKGEALHVRKVLDAAINSAEQDG